ncbi:HAD-like domain-containing protein [Xylogone sp. PMI_703]|nr:HAD-like domain-containing protein [Xylogone sp. PMI_703]
MLSRAAVRSLNVPVARANATGVRLPSSSWIRGMAKNNKPNLRPNKPLDSSKVTSSSSSSGSKPPVPPSAFEAAQKAKAERQRAAAEAAAASQEAPRSEPETASAANSEQPPSQPLPDLTQGIPSTLEFEAAARTSKRDHIDPTEADEAEEPHRGGRGRGELPASAYVSSSEKKRARFANYMYASFAAFSVGATIYLGRNWESEEEEKKHADAPSGWGIGLMWNRARARLGDQLSYYNEPAFRKLLPDVDPIFERPYTLVLSLEDLLIHSEWTREHGWRLAKRPGVDYFLRYLSQYYELVIFTSQPWAVAEPIIRKLDPYHIVTWPLFREATLYENGEYIKDLAYLNRDLSKVIMIDTNPAHAKHQPENAIILPKWTGDPRDKELISLIPFLEYIHTMAYPDVRKTLKSFEGSHIPTEFARREAIARKKFQEQLAEEQKKRPKRSGLGLLTNALGVKQGSMMIDPTEQSTADALAQGKMLQDIARERGQRNYEALEKEIRENGEKWLKEEAAAEEKAKEEGMKAMKSGFTGWFGGPGQSSA